jgi:hypothetical protein
MDLIKELADYLRGMAPEAVIRNGDYPRERGLIDVTLILSEFNFVEKVKDYYSKASGVIHELKGRREEFEGKLKEIEEVSKDIPTLQ